MSEGFTKLMKSFPWELHVKHYGKFCVYEIGTHTHAKVEIVTNGTQDHYDGFQVTIINKTSGKVDSVYFPFNEHMSTRSDVRCLGKDPTWYLSTPDKKSLDTFTRMVENFILGFDTGAPST